MIIRGEGSSGATGGRLAGMWASALFWTVASTYAASWLLSEVANLHYAFDPNSAEVVWSPWWYVDHPLSQFFWGATMLACAAGLWFWMGYCGVRDQVAARGDLGALIILLIIATVIADWLLAFPIDAAAVAITGVEDLPSEKPGYEVEETWAHLPGDLFSSVIAAPIFEELAYRGLLLGVLLARGWRMSTSIILVSALFAFAHSQYYIWGQVGVFLFGVMMGYLRIASGGLAAPILAHAATNLFITILIYAGSE